MKFFKRRYLSTQMHQHKHASFTPASHYTYVSTHRRFIKKKSVMAADTQFARPLCLTLGT